MIEKSAQDFYDDIANYYDSMIRFQERNTTEKKILKLWVDKYHFKSVLDAACGSGLHTIALTQLSVQATGVDISPQMIARASKNARDLGLTIPFEQSPLQEMDKRLVDKFDTVLILGNSLPHLTDERELRSSLVSIRKVLTDNGFLILQILNYERILNDRQRVISVSRNGEHEFIRFYDFIKPYVRFNVLHIHWQNTNPQHEINSTQLYPYNLSELSKILTHEGFTIQDVYGSMNFDAYNPKQSKNLIIVAQPN